MYVSVNLIGYPLLALLSFDLTRVTNKLRNCRKKNDKNHGVHVRYFLGRPMRSSNHLEILYLLRMRSDHEQVAS